MTMPSTWLLAMAVAGGGAAGAVLRHFANQFFLHRSGFGLPMATWLVNVAGCFLAGLLLIWVDGRGEMAPFWRALLITGLLGGLTTFSAFGLELWQLLRADRYLLAVSVVAAHVIVGVAAVALGWRLGRIVWGS
jgi:CrcB protein